MVFITIPSRSINLSAKLRFPLIKFRHGTAREQHQKPAAEAAKSASNASQTTQSSEVIYDFQLPLRFKRKPISEEEIAYINRGGPE